MTNVRRYLVAIVFVLFYPSFVHGNDFRIVPSISVKEEYNSNILFATDNIKRDFITTVSPGIQMVNRTDRFDTDLLARWDWLEYADNRDLSATNQTYNGKLRYLVTPLSSMSAEAGYLKNSNPTLDVGTFGNVMTNVTLNRITSSLSASYQFTEKTATAVSYAYRRDYFNNPRYLDNISHDVNAGLIYDFGKQLSALKGRMNVGYSHYSYPDIRTDSVMVTVGFSRDFNEIWSIQADGGTRHTWSDESRTESMPATGREELSNDSWSWMGNVSLNFKGEHGSGALMYSSDLTSAYGFNAPTERNSLTLSAQSRLTHELSALFAAGYNQFKSDPSVTSGQSINERNFYIRPGCRYEFSKDMAAEASYEYAMSDNKVSDRGTNRHLFSVRFSVQHSFFE